MLGVQFNTYYEIALIAVFEVPQNSSPTTGLNLRASLRDYHPRPSHFRYIVAGTAGR